MNDGSECITVADYLGRSVVQADWLGSNFGSHTLLVLYLSNELGELLHVALPR